jgi:hypothetical protein
MYIHRMRIRNVLLCFVIGSSLRVSGPAQSPPLKLPDVPTTHVLAIGRLTKGTVQQDLAPVIQQEVRDTMRLYLGGKIDQWFVRNDQPGVIFLMNASTVAEAHAVLAKLPMGVGNLMEFELIPVGPLSPLGLLLRGGEAPK